jgi:hypothetical protein
VGPAAMGHEKHQGILREGIRAPKSVVFVSIIFNVWHFKNFVFKRWQFKKNPACLQSNAQIGNLVMEIDKIHLKSKAPNNYFNGF